MEVSLVLSASGGKLVYAVSAVFRAAMAAIAAIMAASLIVEGQPLGPGAWIALALVALAGLYEERWTFDSAAGTITNRAGLVFLSRRRTIAMDEVARFRIEAFVRGTLPGSADEAAHKAAALSGSRGDDESRRRSPHKKPYLRLFCETADGSSYFINAMPARRAAILKEQAARIAAACGKDVAIGF